MWGLGFVVSSFGFRAFTNERGVFGLLWWDLWCSTFGTPGPEHLHFGSAQEGVEV